MKGKLWIILIVGIVLSTSVMMVYYEYDRYLLSVHSDFFSIKNIGSIMIVLSSLLGLALKKELGWILTAIIFYSFLMAGIRVPSKIDLNVSLFAYVFVYTIVLIPILLINSLALREFFKLKTDSGLIRRNAIALVLSAVIAILID